VTQRRFEDNMPFLLAVDSGKDDIVQLMVDSKSKSGRIRREFHELSELKLQVLVSATCVIYLGVCTTKLTNSYGVVYSAVT
jgi:hypothetical protein